MSKQQLNQSFEKMTPTKQQKQKMLNHILSEVKEEPKSSGKVVTLKPYKNLKYITTIAACFVGIIFSANVFKQYTTQEPTFDSPIQFHNYLYYQGNRYEEIGFIDPEITELSQQLGQIKEIIKQDDEIESKQFASTVGLGGTLWTVKDIPKEKQIVLEHEGIFYLFEYVE